MGYNKNAYIKTKDSFTEKLNKAKDSAYYRTLEAYAAIPELREIDRTLAGAGADIALEIAKGKVGIEERINALGEANLALQQKRAELLKQHGYACDHTQIKYECPKCEDTGFVGVNMCDCFKKELIANTIRSSGIGALADTQSFENFDLKYYASDRIVFESMKSNLEFTREYAEEFSEKSRGLLFIGKTGLGKTHLSTAIAKRVIQRGYDVVYDTAQNILSDFEYERFGRGYNSENNDSKTDKYFECDLLIIDDLGTEMTNTFTLSTFYNLINTRINNGKPMLISTNLHPQDLRSRYDERITSRLFGSFDSVMFTGTDIRMQKLQ